MGMYTDIRRILANAVGRPIPRQKPLSKKEARKITQQGDLAPLRIGGEYEEPELGMLVKQLYYEGRGTEVAFPVKTEAFGPYNPAHVPLWVLKMMRRDFAIKLASGAFFGPLLNSDRYYLEGGDPKTRGLTEFYTRPLLPKLLRTGLQNAAHFGFQAHEIVFDEAKPTISFNTDGGGSTQLRNAIIPRAFNDLDPEMVELYFDQDTGKFEGIEAGLYAAHSSMMQLDEPKFLPATKIFLTTYGLEFGKFRGNSWLVSAYNPWWWKNVGYLYWGRFQERLGMGVYVGRAPNEKRMTPGGVFQHCINMVTGLLLQLRQGGVITLPHETDDKGNQKFGVELLESKNDGEGFKKWIDHLTISVMRGLMIPDRLVIQDGAGSFAGQEATAEQFFAIQEATVDDTFLEAYNQQVVAPIIRYNYGSGAPVPRYVAAPLNPAIRKNYFDLIKGMLTVPVKQSKEAAPKKKAVGVGVSLSAGQMPPTPSHPVGAPTRIGDAPALKAPDTTKPVGHPDNPLPEAPPPKEEYTLQGTLDVVRMAKNLALPIRPESEWLQTDSAPPQPPNSVGKNVGFAEDPSMSDKEKHGERSPTGTRLSVAEFKELMPDAAERAKHETHLHLNVEGAQVQAPAPVVIPAPQVVVHNQQDAQPAPTIPAAVNNITIHAPKPVIIPAPEVTVNNAPVLEVKLPPPRDRRAVVTNHSDGTQTVEITTPAPSQE